MRAPAKINLGLRITGRRDDGYHELASVFLPLDLCDELELEPADDFALCVEGRSDGVPAGDDNLVLRAARRFFEAAGLQGGLAIRLHKVIPSAAGLGGGSSDAAAVLAELDARHPGRVAPERLRELALGLGADVPYFLDPRPAWVTGIGERIEPLEGVPSLTVLLGNPGIPLATSEVYAAWDALDRALTRAPGGPTMRPPPALREAGSRIDRIPREELAGMVRNDLEAAATRLCPPIARLRERLGRAGAIVSGLSGSGPTVFGLFSDRADADRAAEVVAPRAPEWCRVAETRGSS